MTIYTWNETWQPGEFPAVLAIGDSWFWYPANNILEAIATHPRLHADYRNMVRLGQNGALLADYIDLPGRPGKFGEQLRRQLAPGTLQYTSMLLISGAGNDAVDYSLGLVPNCSGATSATDCISETGMHELLRGITLSISLLLHEAMWGFARLNRIPRVLLHCYDYAVPDGRGFDLADLTLAGPWLKPAMDQCRVPADPELRKAIVRLLIDHVHQAFARYHNPAQGIWLVDSRGVLDAGANFRQDWANELHPTRSGFKRVVDERWMPVLAEIGVARS